MTAAEPKRSRRKNGRAAAASPRKREGSSRSSRDSSRSSRDSSRSSRDSVRSCDDSERSSRNPDRSSYVSMRAAATTGRRSRRDRRRRRLRHLRINMGKALGRWDEWDGGQRRLPSITRAIKARSCLNSTSYRAPCRCGRPDVPPSQWFPSGPFDPGPCEDKSTSTKRKEHSKGLHLGNRPSRRPPQARGRLSGFPARRSRIAWTTAARLRRARPGS
jgi:hypothetical protein